MTTGKTIALTKWTIVGKLTSLLLNMLFSFVITFLPRSNCLLISWLQSPSAVILEPKKKSFTVSIVSPSIYHDVMGPDAMILVFWMLSFKPSFSLSSFTFLKRFFSSFLFAFCHKGGVIYISEVIDISPDNLDSNLFFIQPGISHDALCIQIKLQPRRTLFPIWNQSVVPYPVLTVASWPEYRFLRRQVRWSGIPISFRIFHSLLWSTQSKALA